MCASMLFISYGDNAYSEVDFGSGDKEKCNKKALQLSRISLSLRLLVRSYRLMSTPLTANDGR